MESRHREPRSFPLTHVAAAAAGLGTALLVALLPNSLLESFAVDSGIAALVAAAEPPLGLTARLALMLAAGGVALAGVWAALLLVAPDRRITLAWPRTGEAAEPAVPVRRADKHPDAPPREPVRAARDLGTPFLEVTARRAPDEVTPPAEQPLPADLDQPLAAFDPQALTPMPAAPPPLVAPLARPRPIAMGERLDVVQLPTPPVTRSPDRPTTATETTVRALLDRLERGIARHSPQPPAPLPATEPAPARGIQDTLGQLRALASQR